MDISSRSRLSDRLCTTFSRYMRNSWRTASGSSSRVEWMRGSLFNWGAAQRGKKANIQISQTRTDPEANRNLLTYSTCDAVTCSSVLPNGGRDVSAPLPGLWCAMSRHCPACRLWEEMNAECQVSTSLRWLGMSGLNTITTPLESFSKAGQHDSNLKRGCEKRDTDPSQMYTWSTRS